MPSSMMQQDRFTASASSANAILLLFLLLQLCSWNSPSLLRGRAGERGRLVNWNQDEVVRGLRVTFSFEIFLIDLYEWLLYELWKVMRMY